MHLLPSVFQNWSVNVLVVVLVRTRLHSTVYVWEFREHHLVDELLPDRVAVSLLHRHVQEIRSSFIDDIMVT
jgi:hypothetical protein